MKPPLFFSGGWAPATPRGTLLERAAEAGLAEGVNMRLRGYI